MKQIFRLSVAMVMYVTTFLFSTGLVDAEYFGGKWAYNTNPV